VFIDVLVHLFQALLEVVYVTLVRFLFLNFVKDIINLDVKTIVKLVNSVLDGWYMSIEAVETL
jgi:hypothetical protein